MRKLVARSIAVATVAVLVSGCSSTGGHKSFSWASLNPMTYFAKSDSDPPLPKPSEQMAPTVTMPSASEIAESGGTAPPSPYSQAGLGSSGQTGVTQTASDSAAQRGMYNLNGYAGTNLPLSSPSAGSQQYPSQTSAGSGYAPTTGMADYQAPQTATTSGYNSTSTGQYALGGGSYDIQSQNDMTPGLPAYANPTAPYGSSAAPTGNSGYQLPPMASPNGYNTGLAQDPYGNTTTSTYPGAATSPATGAATVPQGAYANALPNNPSSTPEMVASVPSLPPLPDYSTNSQVPYVPGDTGYNPPNVPNYTPPSPGGYVQPATATEPNYAPGSVSRYPSSSASGTYGSTGVY